jgi:hypothetical protein
MCTDDKACLTRLKHTVTYDICTDAAKEGGHIGLSDPQGNHQYSILLDSKMVKKL